MPSDCPLSDLEREGKIRAVLEKEMSNALDNYFKESPFMVDAVQHFEDHAAMYKLRGDLSTVKSSFLRSLGRLFAAACVGALSWKAISNYIVEKN